ncbi:hypothetical protein pb186bvf_019893 [Paramecium bursaria]
MVHNLKAPILMLLTMFHIIHMCYQLPTQQRCQIVLQPILQFQMMLIKLGHIFDSSHCIHYQIIQGYDIHYVHDQMVCKNPSLDNHSTLCDIFDCIWDIVFPCCQRRFVILHFYEQDWLYELANTLLAFGALSFLLVIYIRNKIELAVLKAAADFTKEV